MGRSVSIPHNAAAWTFTTANLVPGLWNLK